MEKIVISKMDLPKKPDSLELLTAKYLALSKRLGTIKDSKNLIPASADRETQEIEDQMAIIMDKITEKKSEGA